MSQQRSIIADPDVQLSLDEDVALYPSSDGAPMGETQLHVQTLIWLHDAVEDILAPRTDQASVAVDVFWYWEKGVPSSCKAPDLMVFMNAGKRLRKSFKSWEEGGKGPDIIFEIASEKTWKECIEEKRELYHRLGVKEYFVFDPLVEFLDTGLRGYRLNNDYAVELDEGEGLVSEVLEARLTAEEIMLRLVDLRTGQKIPTRLERADEQSERAKREREWAMRERERADALEAEVLRPRELLGQTGKPDTTRGNAPRNGE